MHNTRQYIEEKREELIYRLDSLVESFHKLTSELEDIELNDNERKKLDQLTVDTLLAIDEIKSEIFSI